MYKLILSARTRKELKKVPKQHREAILLALDEVKNDPFEGKPLSRELIGRFSYRVGVYRVIYQVNKQNQTIYISTAAHRGKVYKRK
ncbi:MAG: hypothetical protein A2172_04625 [Candidatus Woykebacteria bacterium RBG_13_40_15]|uniref:Addiction module toxin RelE n=1 Tax=Candidatus Woykebacteria bacterium RBG_13_40_15 TaxID=1802593 RepID=A0A1G1W789_9BACT|nr:MAG: hypothetical protein A2172_04625 [Candidatus Woykebacteria bacterium RBG_13_40_15]